MVSSGAGGPRLFPAMNIYGLFSALRTRGDLVPGHRACLLGFPGHREEAWRGLPLEGQGLVLYPHRLT